jgi:CheY-like chemotaxis protein
MNAIVGFSALLGEPNLDAQTQQSYIEMIMQSSNHLLTIIKDILDISNIEANLVKVEKSEFNLNAGLMSLYDQFIIRAKEKNLSLFCEYGLEYSDAYIYSDNPKLFQILTNLIDNAIKFTNEGSIIVNYNVQDKFLKFSVTDSGIGIPMEFQANIFERFFQVKDSMSRIYEGTGLGLSISKAYVELLGGKIWVLSKPETGTTIFFTIPYLKKVVEGMPVKDITVTESFVFDEKKKILVVEDIESNFVLIRYFLSKSNATIIRATNGREAVEKTSLDKGIDLILMDIRMPEMDGLAATRLIRMNNPLIPIIAQSAYVDEKEIAIESGCSGFITKPFDKKGLFKVLREFF